MANGDEKTHPGNGQPHPGDLMKQRKAEEGLLRSSLSLDCQLSRAFDKHVSYATEDCVVSNCESNSFLKLLLLGILLQQNK